MTKQTIRLLIILFAVYSGIFVYSYTLNVDLMEARNFVTAREMIQNHNWLTPTMNGELRVAKPPLPTWLTAAAMKKAHTDTDLLYNRLPAGAAGLLAAAFMFLFVRSLTGSMNTAVVSAMVLSTSYMFMFMARKGTWDIFCHSFMLGAVWAIYEGLKREQKARAWFISAGVLMALSWMSKGPISFYTILLPFMISLPILTGVQIYKTHWKNILIAAGVCLVLSLLWPAYLYFKMPAGTAGVIGGEIQAWGSRHIKPFWYYIQFPIDSGIWLIPALAFFWPKYAIEKAGGKKRYFFLAAWVLLEVVLLSVIPEKKDRYLLPVAITMAIPIAMMISGFTGEGRFEKAVSRFYRYLSIAFLAAGSLAAPYCLLAYDLSKYLAAFFVVIILVLSAVIKFRIHEKMNPFTFTALCFALLMNTAVPLASNLSSDKDFMELISLRKKLTDSTVYSDNDNMKLVWAAGRMIRVPDAETLAGLEPLKDSLYITKDPSSIANLLDSKPFTYTPVSGTDSEVWHIYRFHRNQ